MRRTKRLAPLLLAALVLLAGCGGGTTTPADTATPDSTPTATPTQTPTPTPTPTVDSVSYPAGLSAAGYTNSSTAMATFREGLASGPTYTTNMDVTVGSTTQTLNATANPSEKRVYAKTYRNGNLSYELYYENGTQYLRNVDPVRYGTTNATFEGAIFGFNGGQFLRIISVLDLRATGVTTPDGTTVITYEITGPREGASDIRDASGTIEVTTEGRLRSIDYTITTTQDQTMRVEWTRTEIGSTSVPTPDWLSQAG